MNDQNENVLNPLPPGYRSLVPFSREHFKGMGRRKGAGASFMSELNSVLIMTPEFFQAARHYPIVFAKDFAGRFIPVGVTGFEEKQNLFVDAEGYWRTDAYLPAYVRRWPFFTVQPESDPKKHFICVDKTGLEPSDEPFLDENGEPTKTWPDTERLINEIESARRMTLDFGQHLTDLDLIEPFEAHAVAHNGERLRMGSLHRVSEERLNKLSDKQIRQLMNKGYLSRIYAHLVSLENFQRLLELRLQRQDAKQG